METKVKGLKKNYRKMVKAVKGRKKKGPIMRVYQ